MAVQGGPPAGFDFNLHQQLNQQHSQSPGEAETLDSVTQKAPDKFVQNVGKMFGVNASLDGAGGLKGETNVGGGFSLSSLTVFRETHGGILASFLKYFTRDLPKGLTDDMQGGGDGFAGGSGSGSGFSDTGGGDMAGMSGMGNMGGGMADFGGGFQAGSPDFAPEAVSYGGKLLSSGVSDMMDFSFSRLGDLTPPSGLPGTGRSGVDTGMAV